MNWFTDLFTQPTVANSVLILSLVIAAGMALQLIRFRGISLGVTWILFVGILLGQLGISIDPHVSHFAKEFGLILFIYSIGLEVGPGFFRSLKSGGIMLNGLALLAILLGCLITVLIIKLSGEPSQAMIGALYGAVTNTPGLGAAQQTFADLNEGVHSPLFAQGYAVAYPLGVVGIILSIVVMRSIFLKQGKDEDAIFQQNARFNGLELFYWVASKMQTHDEKKAQRDREKLEAKKSRAARIAAQNRLNERDNKPHLFYIFIGIALGVILGMVPIYFPGIPVAVRLGLAGGPLIISIIISSIGPDLRFPTHTTKSANLMIRELGISLFMATVGLGAGDGFIQTIANGGYMWVIYGFIITIVPCFIVGLIARYICHLSIYSVAGLIAGSHTDPPALAFSNTLCPNNESSVAYTTVYPLTMFLRILAGQILVILLS